MCGIFCVFSKSGVNTTEKLSKLFQEYNYNLSRRGPNQSKIEICHNGEHIFLFAASVLWLQGSKMTKQPLDEEDYLLVYNGDIFDDKNEDERRSKGDTKLFLDILKSDKSFESLFHINGPFAFVCLDKKNGILHYGRDKYGRRSLLMGLSPDEDVIFTSVAKRNSNFKFKDLPSVGIFSLDLKTMTFSLKPWFQLSPEATSVIGGQITVGNPIYEGRNMMANFVYPTFDDLKLFQLLKNLPVSDILSSILSSPFMENVRKLKKYLEQAIEKRISNQPKFCQDCIREYRPCTHALVGVLFSGGVDCAILALIANEFVEIDRPIDLLNVAFSNNDFDTPDRLSGRQTLNELKMLCPDRKWNFVEINVNFDELDRERSNRIADLIYPLNTILDESLGCALWFASRGKSETYVSPCRVLLVGMGADELFGGYTRHRAALRNNNWEALNLTMSEDWEKLPHRNFGRDDRVVSDHGRQLRTPYMDERVVEYIQSLKLWEKTFPSDELPQEVGPKFLLRALAYHLGLKQAAILRKRALQFGSRIANSKENGNEKSPRL